MNKRFLNILSLVFYFFSISLAAQNDFNTKHFNVKANSILSSISGNHIELKNSSYVLSKKNTSEDYLSVLNLAKAFRFLKYQFDAGNSNRNLSFWIIDIVYMNEKEAQQAIMNLNKISGKVDGENDHCPGLTYSNDYVIRDKNRILWLNSSCLYSKENHLKLIEYFKESLKHKLDESITCDCGEVQCEYSGSH